MAQQNNGSYGEKEDKEPLATTVLDSTENIDEDLALDEKPERNKKSLSRGQKILAGVAIALVIGAGGMIANVTYQNHVASASSVETGSKTAPAEAKNFMDQYGSEYSDPISTYYAEKGYEQTHNGAGALIGTDYINSTLEANKQNDYNGETCVLGFNMTKLPLDSAINQATSIDIFNKYTAKNLSLYMNLIAKNPDPKAIEVIDGQFLAYCLGTYTNADRNVIAGNQEAITEANKLLNTAKSVVKKYGSAANYTVAQASNNDNDLSKTQFGHIATTNARVDSNGNNIGFSDSGVNLVIDIDLYSGEKVLGKTETIKDVQLSVNRQRLVSGGTSADPIYKSSEYISIGQG